MKDHKHTKTLTLTHTTHICIYSSEMPLSLPPPASASLSSHLSSQFQCWLTALKTYPEIVIVTLCSFTGLKIQGPLLKVVEEEDEIFVKVCKCDTISCVHA